MLVSRAAVWSISNLDTSQLNGAIPSGRFIALIAVVLVVQRWEPCSAIPFLRKKVLPEIRTALLEPSGRSPATGVSSSTSSAGSLWARSCSSPSRSARPASPTASTSVSRSSCLVNVISSTLASLVPVPGGIGAAEAAISGGPRRDGRPGDGHAFAIALTHRLCTYYLPPIWGYASLHWLRRKGYV